jgi:regulator of sirC expression with transglutaminase-like and TPR domain
VSHDDRRRALAKLARDPARTGCLVEGCLLIAQGETPDLGFDHCVAEVARLAAHVKVILENDGGRPWRALQFALGKQADFCGDRATYDDPENSYLDRVLARKRGLPILLSVLWVEVARGAGIPAEGIGLPGHFLARIGEGNETTFVDPFDRGLPVSRDDAMRRAATAVGEADRRDPAWLEPVDPKAIFTRVLANLVNAYARRGDDLRLERTLGDLLALRPGEGSLLAKRGEARQQLGDVPGALLDLNEALTRLDGGPLFDRAYELARKLARMRESQN